MINNNGNGFAQGEPEKETPTIERLPEAAMLRDEAAMLVASEVIWSIADFLHAIKQSNASPNAECIESLTKSLAILSEIANDPSA